MNQVTSRFTPGSMRSPNKRTSRVGAWALSAAATAIWLFVVVVAGYGRRVADNWESGATMLFGSFLAGASPEGGSAVAFPVFTKGLDVPGPVARTFGLSIQAVGMTMAVIAILMSGRPFHRRAAVVGSVAAVVGFLASVVLLGKPSVTFWPSAISTPWVKAIFSIVLATTSILMVRHLRHTGADHPLPGWNRRFEIGLALAALAGGFLSSLAGTGANILVFLFLVVLADVNPKTALPSAIMVMTAVSLVGFVLFSVIDQQFAIGPDDPAAKGADLLGLWLAAVPVVVWGAPLGSWAAGRVREDFLVKFVALLASVEVATTFLLVPELRTSPALITFLITGLLVLPTAFLAIRRNRMNLFGT